MYKPRTRFGETATILSALTLAACAGYGTMAESAPVQFSDGILVDLAGMTLYTFDKDASESGKSMCNDTCAKNWPPLKAEAGDHATASYSIITRDDGSRQWAYQGKPLYLWVKDEKPGDMKGENFKNVWHVVRQSNAEKSSPPARHGYSYGY